jgi:hypothetical protein
MPVSFATSMLIFLQFIWLGYAFENTQDLVQAVYRAAGIHISLSGTI